MIVSWKWLADYAELEMPAVELERRLMMAGLNHESTTPVGDDLAIDLEVTSNRPDCLGHIGVAREIAVLWREELKLPAAKPAEGSIPVGDVVRVRIDCPELCPRYTARVIRGARIGPSPAWLAQRLTTVGIAAVNNVVDITNYVLMECGQPLHAFDLAKLTGPEIIVREGRAGEALEAIDHKKYEVGPGICVIADARRPVAIGGVMGGAATEVTSATRDLLIESAEFDPLSIRNTARKLNLHSDSSFRFERGLDTAGVDWASRRACELILDIAGGELAAGVLDVGRQPEPRATVSLRFDQIERILGIPIDPLEVRRILASLGSTVLRSDALRCEVRPPSWRRDLEREIDLIEEAARIHGYEEIPEDIRVPMTASAKRDEDRALEEVRRVLAAAGFDEALTISLVDLDWNDAFSPWTSAPPLSSQRPIVERADRLRRSLVPSLLGARKNNERVSNHRIELYEIAKAYLPRDGSLPEEALLLGVTSGGDFAAVKGLVEALAARLNPALRLDIEPTNHELLDPVKSCQLLLDGELLGVLGEVSHSGLERFELRGATTIAELKLQPLIAAAALIRQYVPQSDAPPVKRDINLVVNEAVRWSDLEAVVRSAAGSLLERVEYRDTYRDPERLGTQKKSLLFALTLRAPRATLTGSEADGVRDRVVQACGEQLGAELRA